MSISVTSRSHGSTADFTVARARVYTKRAQAKSLATNGDIRARTRP